MIKVLGVVLISLICLAAESGHEGGNSSFCTWTGIRCSSTQASYGKQHPRQKEILDLLIKEEELPRAFKDMLIKDLDQTVVLYSSNQITYDEVLRVFKNRSENVDKANNSFLPRGVYLHSASYDAKSMMSAITYTEPLPKVIYFEYVLEKMESAGLIREIMKLVLHEQAHRLSWFQKIKDDEQAIEAWAELFLSYLLGESSYEELKSYLEKLVPEFRFYNLFTQSNDAAFGRMQLVEATIHPDQVLGLQRNKDGSANIRFSSSILPANIRKVFNSVDIHIPPRKEAYEQGSRYNYRMLEDFIIDFQSKRRVIETQIALYYDIVFSETLGIFIHQPRLIQFHRSLAEDLNAHLLGIDKLAYGKFRLLVDPMSEWFYFFSSSAELEELSRHILGEYKKDPSLLPATGQRLTIEIQYEGIPSMSEAFYFGKGTRMGVSYRFMNTSFYH